MPQILNAHFGEAEGLTRMWGYSLISLALMAPLIGMAWRAWGARREAGERVVFHRLLSAVRTLRANRFAGRAVLWSAIKSREQSVTEARLKPRVNRGFFLARET